MSDLSIDAFEFCRSADQREGSIPIANMHRLCAEVIGNSGIMQWSLSGSADAIGHPKLVLVISGAVNVICQRCLMPMVFEVASRSELILAKDEAEADRIEALLDDEQVDVIVGSKAMRIVDLVEDDALLSIPSSVKHEVCSTAVSDVLDIARRPSAFAGLKDLKR